MVVVALGPEASSADDVGGNGIRKIGTLARIPADVRAALPAAAIPTAYDQPGDTRRNGDLRNAVSGTMIMIPAARQLWQFYPTSGDTWAAVRDLDTLKLVKVMPLGGLLRRGAVAGASAGEWMHAIDGGRRLFLVKDLGSLLFEIDLRTFAVTKRPFEPELSFQVANAAATSLGGITYDAKSDAIIGLWGQMAGNFAANTNTYVGRFPLATGGTPLLRLVRSCNGPLPSTDITGTLAVPVLLGDNDVWIPCQRAGFVGSVVRVPRSGLLAPESPEEIAVGPTFIASVLADQQAKRLYFITSTSEIWAFDAVRMSFVGVVASNAEKPSSYRVAFGLDPVSGRIFFLSSDYGVGIVEGRFFPLPQARTLPSAKSEARDYIYSDAKTGRFFVLPKFLVEKPLQYDIYEAGAAPAPPGFPDPDSNTIDRDEQEGVTEQRYFGSGSGYGTRVLLANGLTPLVPSPSVGPLSPVAALLSDNISPKCGFSDRELVAGRVVKAEYDTGSTAAVAIAADVDDRTKLDLQRPSRCDINIKDPNGTEQFKGIFSTAPVVTEEARTRIDDTPPDEAGNDPDENDRLKGDRQWRRTPAECSSSEGGERKQATGNDQGQQSLGSSEVDCQLPGRTLIAKATARLHGALSVGNSSTETTIERVNGTAVVSTVTATARDIDFANGLLQIGEVRAHATSRSNGRPSKEPLSTYRYTLKRVKLNGAELCGDTCDPGVVLPQLNQALAGRAEIRGGAGLDDRLVKGSPKGALTAVQKSLERQASDRALVGDFTVDVPALEIIVYNDNGEWGRARQVYQFAGVASAASYNISLRPTGLGFDDAPSFDDEAGGDGLDDFAQLTDGSGSLGASGAHIENVSGTTPNNGGGGVIAAIANGLKALARGIRLFLTNPRHALLLLTGWGLFTLPAVLARRRLLLTTDR